MDTSAVIRSDDLSENSTEEREAAAMVEGHGYYLLRWDDGSGYHLDGHISRDTVETWATLPELMTDWLTVAGAEEPARPCPACSCERICVERKLFAHWDGDCDECNRYPQSYFSSWEDPGFFTRQIEVQTDGAEYLAGRSWSEMTVEERDEQDEWTDRLHELRVRFARLDPEDRELLGTWCYDDCDPDDLERLFSHLEEHKAA